MSSDDYSKMGGCEHTEGGTETKYKRKGLPTSPDCMQPFRLLVRIYLFEQNPSIGTFLHDST